MKIKKAGIVFAIATIVLSSIVISGCASKAINKTQSQSNLSSSSESKTNESAANSLSSEITSSDTSSANGSSTTSNQTTYLQYINARFGFSIDYPSDLVAKSSPDNGDGQTFESKDGTVDFGASGINNVQSFTPDEYLKQIVLPTINNVTYQDQGSNWIIVSWDDGNTIGYEKDIIGTGSINTFYIKYPASRKAEFDAIILHMSQSIETPGINNSY